MSQRTRWGDVSIWPFGCRDAALCRYQTHAMVGPGHWPDKPCPFPRQHRSQIVRLTRWRRACGHARLAMVSRARARTTIISRAWPASLLAI